MKHQKTLLARAGMFLLAGTLLVAAGARATPQDFLDQEVKEVGSGGAAEGIYIITANTDSSVDGCGPRFFLETGNPLLNQNLALALSALYGRSRVHLHVDDCQGPGHGERAMRLKSIRLLR